MNKNKIYILGGSQTDFSRNWTKEGKSFYAILNEILNDTLCSVEIEESDVMKLNKTRSVGVFIGNFAGENFVSQGHLGAFLPEINNNFSGVPVFRCEAACASGGVALDAAVAKIASGQIDVAIILGVELMKNVDSKKAGDYLGQASWYEKEAMGIDYPFPGLFSRFADLLLKKYKIKEKDLKESFSAISFHNFSQAKLNPKAQTRNWLIDKKLIDNRGGNYNRYISKNLAIYDSSPLTDGAVGIVLCSENYVKKRKSSEKKPFIKGSGFRTAPISFKKKTNSSLLDKYILPITREAITDAYQSAGLTPPDIQIFEIHDCFTISELLEISHIGLCQPGEECKFILKGGLEKKNINLSGGLMGVGHPVGASGLRMMLDLYKQIMGLAGDYQGKGPLKNGLMLNIGGSFSTNIAFIIGK